MRWNAGGERAHAPRPGPPAAHRARPFGVCVRAGVPESSSHFRSQGPLALGTGAGTSGLPHPRCCRKGSLNSPPEPLAVVRVRPPWPRAQLKRVEQVFQEQRPWCPNWSAPGAPSWTTHP